MPKGEGAKFKKTSQIGCSKVKSAVCKAVSKRWETGTCGCWGSCPLLHRQQYLVFREMNEALAKGLHHWVVDGSYRVIEELGYRFTETEIEPCGETGVDAAAPLCQIHGLAPPELENSFALQSVVMPECIVRGAPALPAHDPGVDPSEVERTLHNLFQDMKTFSAGVSEYKSHLRNFELGWTLAKLWIPYWKIKEEGMT